jgi:hypothetical protein
MLCLLLTGHINAWDAPLWSPARGLGGVRHWLYCIGRTNRDLPGLWEFIKYHRRPYAQAMETGRQL